MSKESDIRALGRVPKDPTKGALGRSSPGARMLGKPAATAGAQNPEPTSLRRRRLQKIASGGR